MPWSGCSKTRTPISGGGLPRSWAMAGTGRRSARSLRRWRIRMGASRLLPRSRSASSVMKRRWILSSGRTEPATRTSAAILLPRLGGSDPGGPLPPSSKRPATRVRMSVSAPYGPWAGSGMSGCSLPCSRSSRTRIPLSGLRRCGRSVRTPAGKPTPSLSGRSGTRMPGSGGRRPGRSAGGGWEPRSSRSPGSLRALIPG